MMKKTVSVLLCLVMLVTLIQGFAFSAGAASSGQCGDSVSWSLSADGTLTISGAGNMYHFYSYDHDGPAPWYEEREKITAAVVKDGVRSVGNYAFYDCRNLRTVTLADSVTAIGKEAFRDCLRLDHVALPPEMIEIEEDTFMNCRHLSDLTVPEGLRAIGKYAFLNCSALPSFSVSERLTEIDFLAFSGCLRLCRIDVSPQHPLYASDENGVVFNKRKTTLVKYPAGKQAGEYTVPDGVTEIAAYAFMGNPYLTKVTLPASVAAIGEYAFYGCLGLRYPAFNGTVTEIAPNTYQYCKGLSDIVIPDNIGTIGASAFADCGRIRKVTVGAGVVSIGDEAFYGADRLLYLYLPKSVQSVGEEAFIYTNLQTVLYAGTKDDWNGIDVEAENDPLTNAEVRYQAKAAEMDRLKMVVYLAGDVTGDMKVAAEDARLALRASVKLEHYEAGSREFLSADANKNGTLGADDARLILRASVNLEQLDNGGIAPQRLLGFSNLAYYADYLTDYYVNYTPAVFDAPYDDFINARRLPENAIVISLIDPEGSLIGTEARIGDIVVSVNGQSLSELGTYVADGKAGDPVTLGLVRILEDGTAYELEVTGTVMLFAD